MEFDEHAALASIQTFYNNRTQNIGKRTRFQVENVKYEEGKMKARVVIVRPLTDPKLKWSKPPVPTEYMVSRMMVSFMKVIISGTNADYLWKCLKERLLDSRTMYGEQLPDKYRSMFGKSV